MKFSIIIPTKNRQMQAIEAVKSCVNSRYKNIEIIVTDTSDENKLNKKISKLSDKRIKYFYHDKKLSMKDNWEFGVSQSTGDFVTVIGDDDALMPEGLVFANELLKLEETEVLHCSTPMYKWPDYQFLNRRNFISVILPTTIMRIDSPQETLRKFYNFEKNPGTGPGLYYGLVAREFLNRLKSMRGSYFIDDNPDFDSGFCTLLYSKKFLETSYPIFISGTCGASNSAAMNSGPKFHSALSTFTKESSKSPDEIIWSELEGFASIEAVIISSMTRFLPEVNKVITGKKIKINKQNIFNVLASTINKGYDRTIFNVKVKHLEKIAKKWRVSTETIPTPRIPSLGLFTDKGPNNETALGEARVERIGIDGNALGVKNIHDAIRVIESLTMEWLVLLNELKLRKGLKHPSKEHQGATLDLIMEKLENKENDEAKELLKKNIVGNPTDAESLMFLGAVFFNEGNFNEAIPHLARSISFKFNIKAFDAYFHSLVNTNQLDFARLTLENYKENLRKINYQFIDHCFGVLEMASGNYQQAASIFQTIKTEIDSSLYYYCAAFAKFSKGETNNADKLVKKALQINGNNKDFLALEAKIVASL